MSKVLFTSSDLKRLSDGTVDLESSVLSFEAKVNNYVAEVELETEAIAAAVGAVFDKHLGVRMNMPFIISQSLQHLNVQPENSKSLTDRVHAYIQENADQDAEYETDPATGKVKGKGDERKVTVPAEEDRTRMFGIGKGKGGGVVRWCDIPAKPAGK